LWHRVKKGGRRTTFLEEVLIGTGTMGKTILKTDL
jgi:hypothetical protein